MAMTNAERQRLARERKKNGTPYEPDLRPCGTYAAARRHERNGEPVCEACLEARRAYIAEKAKARRARLAK